ncbi:MAG: S26 family signal peptidase [Pseudomonadota bacterium]
MKSKTFIFCILLPGALAVILAFSEFEPRPTLLYNPTSSAPKGWYIVDRNAGIKVGDLVAAFLPDKAADLAITRSYLPSDIPVIKTVWADAGTEYCVEQGWFKTDGRPPLRIHPLDSQGLMMPAYQNGCRRISRGHYLLISERIETSFDSRYFGEVGRESILGQADLIWETR